MGSEQHWRNLPKSDGIQGVLQIGARLLDIQGIMVLDYIRFVGLMFAANDERARRNASGRMGRMSGLRKSVRPEIRQGCPLSARGIATKLPNILYPPRNTRDRCFSMLGQQHISSRWGYAC